MSSSRWDPDPDMLRQRMAKNFDFAKNTHDLLFHDVEVKYDSDEVRERNKLQKRDARARLKASRPAPTLLKYRGICQRDNHWVIKKSTGFHGQFSTALEAARAYDELATRKYGAKAVTNASLGVFDDA